MNTKELTVNTVCQLAAEKICSPKSQAFEGLKEELILLSKQQSNQKLDLHSANHLYTELTGSRMPRLFPKI